METPRLKTRTAAALALVLAASASVPTAVLAHHSFAMFDRTKVETIKGTVKEYQWTNPHVWIQLVVRDPQGQAVEWSIEGAGPNMLYRQGWDNNTFKAGDAGFKAGVVSLGVADQGVGLAMDDNNKSLITADAQTAVDTASKGIADGSIKVHDYMADSACP